MGASKREPKVRSSVKKNFALAKFGLWGVSMENIFERQLTKNTVFLNKDIISPHYIPEKLPYREKQIEEITHGLGAVASNSKPNNFFIYGKTGCIKEDSLVYTDKGYKKIVNVSEKEDKILSYNIKKQAYEWSDFKFLKFKNEKNLLKITLDNGLELTVTGEHPLLLKNMTWKRSDKLKILDELVLGYNLPNKTTQECPLALARLLGFTLSDGSLNQKKKRTKDGRGNYYNSDRQRFRYFSTDEKLLNQVKYDLQKLFGGAPQIIYPKNRCQHVNLISQKACQTLNKYGVPFGKKSGIIRIPQIILESNPIIQKEFLKALFSGDGTVSQQTYQLEYYSNSKAFLQDISLILLQEGIISKIREKKIKLNNKQFISYRLYINSQENLNKFYQKISFYSEDKEKKLLNILKKYQRVMPAITETHVISKIIKIQETYEEFVYDLVVPKNHCFIANGIISHNTGKTSTVKHVLEQLDDFVANRNLPVKSCYVNCRSHPSKYKVLLKSLRTFYPNKEFLGYSASFVYEKLLSFSNENNMHLILILDEIDKIKDVDDLMYSLSRGNDEVTKGSITVIGISNNLTFKEKLDPRTKSSLCEREMVFDPYNATELKEIIKERCEQAFKKDSVTNGAISLAAALAAQESGDARTAVMLMQRAGEIADMDQSFIIDDTKVEKAKASVEEEIIISMISTLPQQQQLVLYAISQLTINDRGMTKVNGEVEKGVLFSGEIFESYLQLAKKFDTRTITSRWYRQYINELEMYGLILVTNSGKGIKGQTRLIKLGFDATKIKQALEKELMKSL